MKNQLVGPAPRTTPAEYQLAAGRRRALPDDLQREASRRLGIIALVGAVLWTVAPVLGHLVGAMSHAPGGFHLGVADAIAAGSVIVSLALFFYSRKRERDPRFVLDVGLGYMVLVAFALGQMFHSEVLLPTQTVDPKISWVGAVVLMFAAIVPSTPRKTLLAGLFAASMNPVGMLIAKARGNWDFGPTSNVLVMHYPDFILVGVAVVISHVVTRLGREVVKARELGSYRLGELLGKGGMGEVYKATHRMLARPAAIKLIRPEMLGGNSALASQVTVRFRREAEAAANLRSPHTVELYDFGVAEDRTMYFVMELLDGLDLETLVRTKGPLPAARAIYIVRQVCESLEEAHARGLVHRDIKPANIHVGRLGLRHDFVKVLDFGLVKSVAPDSAEDSLETAAGATPGTPAYLAPEAAVGGTVDGRTDLYALGCVTYYLLTGHLVFEAKTAVEMVSKHIHEEPVAPSRRTELPVPVELDRLVLACLAKKPEDRPAGAAELSRSLAAIEGEEWGEEKAMNWWKVNRPAS
jgi:eukaryotic-like serine/threonine-protein kinase